ncbi:MAG: toll/interleukin-1 receptor domain-containing protein, partial [Gammaproteobacteria bacterium]|nr:toll/interleukin-1 receptor domain-containing protein [Gammaproteobacteria bacterium]
MSEIFVSYASADRPRAKMLADNLSGEGWSVWWDRTIPPGKTFDEVIEAELAAAGCVIVIWSSASVDSSWVRAEAGEAMNRGVLIPVIMEQADIPLVFRPIQAADLTDWSGETDHSGYRQLVAAIAAAIKTLQKPSPDTVSPERTDRPGIAHLRARVLKAKSEGDLEEVRRQLASLLADEPDNTEAKLLITHVDGALTELRKPPVTDHRGSRGGAVPTRTAEPVWRRGVFAVAVLVAVGVGAWLSWLALSPDEADSVAGHTAEADRGPRGAGEQKAQELAAQRAAEADAQRQAEQARAAQLEAARERELAAQRAAEADA